MTEEIEDLLTRRERSISLLCCLNTTIARSLRKAKKIEDESGEDV